MQPVLNQSGWAQPGAGIAIIEQVNKAIRAHRSPLETIALISEPIAALDIAGETLLAALTITCLQHTHSDETAIAVLTGFAGLQNPETQYLMLLPHWQERGSPSITPLMTYGIEGMSGSMLTGLQKH
ncbi:hypothetical protein GMW71_00045 [Pectobacterium brasiliense]|nr:hypothetical protein GMW71_00045 [Pectobacterium brasiliense]